MKWLFINIILVLVCVVSHAADPIYNLETWSDPGTAGWTNQAVQDVLISNKSGSLYAEYLKQDSPEYVEDVISVPVAKGSHILNVGFSLTAITHKPSMVKIKFHASHSDNLWSLVIPSPEVGVPMVVDRSLSFSEGWTKGPVNIEGEFNQDIMNIDWLGIYIVRNGDPALQDYSIDDVLIQGLFYIVDNDLDGIADSWEQTHGLSSNDVNDASGDSDGDGISNYAEYRAGTNPEDPGSMFWAKIDKISNGGEVTEIELRWDSATNRSYTVWRSSDLSGDFSEFVEGVYSTPPENVYRYPAETNAPAYFYQIEVDPEL